jgi:thymidylate kinase
MDKVITFTPAELIAVITAVCGTVVSIGAVVALLVKVYDKLKAPEKAQDKRLELIELKLDSHDKILEKYQEFFTNDDNRFKSIERSNKVTQNALLALLKHALNGNDVDALKEAEKGLEAYLIEK